MTGATITCSRSRQRAARNRDKVSAPPSTSGRREPPVGQRQIDHFDPVRRRTSRCARRDQQASHAVGGEYLRTKARTALGIDDDARRLRTGHAPHRQLRIVGDDRADADHHGVDERPQAMQMGKPGGPVDVARVTGDGGGAPVERLSDLADHHEIVDRSAPYRSK